MSVFHCSCGFAINDPGEFGDHLRAAFDRPDDIGTDGRVHAELITDAPADAGGPGGADAPAGADGAGGADCPGGADADAAGRREPIVCACGFQAADAAEYDDHSLLVLIPPDNIGTDGKLHVPVDPSTPERWYFPEFPRD